MNNYGTTQEKLKEYFDEVEFVNFQRKDTYGKGLIKTFSKGNIIKALAFLPTFIYWKHVFNGFQKKYLNIEKKKLLSMNDFENYKCSSDVYFTGSDQVWNTGWNNGVLLPMYLSFVPKNIPKYAYAASFGNNNLSSDDINKSFDYISQYKKIAVREKSGIDILKRNYNYNNSICILDPTLSMNGDFWRKYKRKEKISKDEKYILIYNLNRSKEFDEYAEKLSRKTGYKLYRFCTRLDQIFRNGKSLIMPEIFDFITLIDNAEIVLTDSFHATAFSINMNTEPICIYPENYSGRISEFLNMIGATCRHINGYDDFDVINRHVDFKKINKVLEVERAKTNKYLEEIINDLKG